MDFIPPRMTKAVRAAIATPVSQTDRPKDSCSIWEMELACTMLPMPKAATAVKKAKTRPSQRALRPRSSTYIGPPEISPVPEITRYFTDSSASAYLVAIPNTPVSHIHSTAPGPPAATAVATPTILPVPMVAASAVVSAPKCEMSPAPSLLRLKESFMPLSRCRCTKPRRKVR